MLRCFHWTPVALLRYGLILVLFSTPFAGPSNPRLAFSSFNPQITLNPPNDLRVHAVMDRSVTLKWSPVPGAVSYRIYRSTLPEIGFQQVASLTARPGIDQLYQDQNLVNQVTYSYQVSSVSMEGTESRSSVPVSAVPALVFQSAVLSQPEVRYTPGGDAPLVLSARYWIQGRYYGDGSPPGIMSQVVYGPMTTAPGSWTNTAEAHDSRFAEECCNQYVQAVFIPNAIISGTPGSYGYAFRFSSDLGRTWVYAGTSTQPIDPGSSNNGNIGKLIISSDNDNTPPIGPTNVRVRNQQNTSATIEWDAGRDTDSIPLFYYDLYRSADGAAPILAARVDGNATVFQDFGLISGTRYAYTVRAVDDGYNYSPLPDPETNPPVGFTTPASPVQVTLNISVPSFTPLGPGAEGIYLHHAVASLWTEGDRTFVPCNQISHTCTWEFTVARGTDIQFHISRGSIDTLETTVDGHIPVPERRLSVLQAGPYVMNLSVRNWDDPLVIAHEPGAGEVPTPNAITLTWNQVMPASTKFNVERANPGLPSGVEIVPGNFTPGPDGNSIIFIPDQAFARGEWIRVRSGRPFDMKGIQQQTEFEFSFTTGNARLMLPLILRP